jgi:hypothetical protein
MPAPAELMRRFVADSLYDVLLAQAGPCRANLLLRALPEDTGISAAVARQVLEGDPRFVEQGGRLGLRIRDSLAGMNLKSAVEALVADRGAPLPIALAAACLAGANGREPDYYDGILRHAAAERTIICAAGEALVPLDWVLFPEGDDEADVLFYSDLEADPLLEALRPACAPDSLRGATPLATAANVVAAAPQPVPNRLLGFFVYRLHPGAFDPLALLQAMLADPRFVALPGLAWTGQEARAWIAAELAEADSRASLSRMPEVDLDQLLAAPLPAEHPGYYIADDDLEGIYELLQASTRPVTVADLLAEVIELAPDHPDYIAAAHSVRTLLVDDPQCMPLGLTRFLGPAGVPAWTREVPAALRPVLSADPADVVLRTEGLRPGLAERLADPYWQDFGDEAPAVSRADRSADETAFALLPHHCAAGALPLRAMDADLFAGRGATIEPMVLVAPGGLETTAWVNHDLGLLLGLGPVVARHQLASGSIITVSSTDVSGRYCLSLSGTDAHMAITGERAAELAALAARPQVSAGSTLDLLQQIMAAHPSGVRFERIVAEISAVRRVTRLQLASLLSYYQVFRPRDTRGDDWVLVPGASGIVTGKDKHVVTQ